MKHEYAFDVKLFAVVRVTAPSKAQAVEGMRAVLHCVAPSKHFLDGFSETYSKEHDAEVRVTEISIEEDGEDENEQPFEIDGEPAK